MENGMLTDDVLVKYYIRRKEDLEICQKALGDRDYEAIERVGHKMKGNGVTFGYPELSRLGEQLETNARESNATNLQEQIKQFETWIASHYRN